MAKCAACKKYISMAVAVPCSLCPSRYHKPCIGVPDSANVSKDWSCPECINKLKKGDNSSTPVRSVSGTTAQSTSCPREIVDESPVLQTTSLADNGVQDLRRELAECLKELKEFRKEMADFRTSVAFLTSRMDGLEQRLEAVEQRSAEPATETTAELERAVAHLKLELNERDQELLQSDLEIGHLPEEKGENILHTVTVLAAKLGVALEERDIVFAERVGIMQGAGAAGDIQRERRVVVRLARRHLRDQLLQSARVRRTLTAADTGRADKTNSRGRIFLNERLTRANRLLFHRVREECRKLQWRFSWTKRGRIYARQADGKAAHHIRHEADFERVFGITHV